MCISDPGLNVYVFPVVFLNYGCIVCISVNILFTQNKMLIKWVEELCFPI